jgi:trehalose 6-phosphate synthase
VRLHHRLPEHHVIGVGVDRLDYTKGIEERLRAVQRFLELHPEWVGRFTFIQIAATTRSSIEHYQMYEARVRALAMRINTQFSAAAFPPVILHAEHHELHEVYEYYRAAELCFVSSLHDGMNLVAKEFIAARDDERGALVLSQFTGAARELPEAIIVNPYDAEECAEALFEEKNRVAFSRTAEISRPVAETLADVLMAAQMVTSKREADRLAAGGGIKQDGVAIMKRARRFEVVS